MTRVEYLVLVGFETPPDPDDDRALKTQADEQIDGWLAMLADQGVDWAEVISVHECGRTQGETDAQELAGKPEANCQTKATGVDPFV